MFSTNVHIFEKIDPQENWINKKESKNQHSRLPVEIEMSICVLKLAFRN